MHTVSWKRISSFLELSSWCKAALLGSRMKSKIFKSFDVRISVPLWFLRWRGKCP